ncbi:MAG: tetratricopeptide repeat protein [Thermoleophilaceae bacterium]|nr:tetratricopeptide repeat protein [Thermoleophilaceae bacterium]
MGPLEVSGEIGPVLVTAAKQRALLVHLLLHANEVVSADALVDALWGERPPASARKLLQIYISQLRKSLGDAVLVTRAPGYLIAVERLRLDSVRFERLLGEGSQALREGNPALASTLVARALALWRGPALTDFAYDSHVQTEARRLEELRVKALEQRIEADLQLGRHARLVGELQALVREYPLQEGFRAQLMLVLYRNGRQAEAVDVYADARRALVAELGVEPSLALRELHRAILNQDPGLQPPPPERPTAAAHLPTPATRLIGRERELDEVQRLLGLPDVRLVTIMGPGGIGKTRLALEAAARASVEFANGVVFVSLGALTDHRLVIPTIAEALGVKEQAGEPLRQTLADALRSRELLLVLDNLEQVLDAAPAFAELLSEAPRLKLLGTSRARLRLSSEHAYLVPPLAVPEPSQVGDLPTVTKSAAVALFSERAGAAKPGFVLTAENALAVAEVCTRLEGVPLAIELAAARIRILTPRSLLERLGRRLPLLTEGAWDLPARQQTLRATIDWSYELLSRAEQSLFARLSVFVGGWTIETAELSCASEDVLQALTGLQDNSLVGHEMHLGEPRYRMLETVREYALEKLDADEASQVRDHHAQAFVALAEQAESELVGPEQAVWQERLEREHGNMRAALGWLHESEQTELELHLAAALGRFWYVHGHLSEGRRRLKDALAHAGTAAPPELRAKGLRTASAIAVIQGEYASARELAEQGLELYRLLGDLPGTVRSLSNLGAILLAEGRAEDAVSALDESIALSRNLPDRRIAALALNNRGDVALTQGDFGAAAALFGESLALLQEVGDTANIARSLFNLGAAALGCGKTSQALELLRESVSISATIGDKEDVAWCLVGLAAVATQGSDPVRGAVILGAADALLEGMGALMKPFERRLQGRTLAAIREQLDARSFDAAWAQGRGLTVEQAVAHAVAEPSTVNPLPIASDDAQDS